MDHLSAQQLDDLNEMAFMRAAELDSPNSIGFDALQERCFDELYDKYIGSI